MNISIRVQLSCMMFLEFFIWGIWFVTMGTFLSVSLKADGLQIGATYATQSLGAIIAPFIIGLVADRYFSAQKILGVLHLIGAGLLWFVAQTNSFSDFYLIILVYMILYMPTLALVNSVSFKQIQDPSKGFASIRVFGTIGWIAAGLLINFLGWESGKTLEKTFEWASICSLILGVYSFTLPDTPPAKKGQKASSLSEILGLDALKILKDKSFLIFFIASTLICVPLAFYYGFANLFLNEAGVENAASKMTMGQMSEVFFMLVFPLFFARFGVKKMLLIGMFAWAFRLCTLRFRL